MATKPEPSAATYRRRHVDRLNAGQEAAQPSKANLDQRRALAADRARPVEERVGAIHDLARASREAPALIDVLLAILVDPEDVPAARLAALTGLQQAAFFGPVFSPKRPAYMDALRAVVDDPNAELRQRAIGILARHKDDYVQQRLIDGLEGRTKALVPATRAIQYLGYDAQHAKVIPLMRRIVEEPPTAAARVEAIRVLSADPKSRPTLARIAQDKSERPKTRTVSAAGLRALDPKRYDQVARRIALDDSDDAAVRASSLSGLARSPTPESPARRTFTRKVEKLAESPAPPEVTRATKAYIARTKR